MVTKNGILAHFDLLIICLLLVQSCRKARKDFNICQNICRTSVGYENRYKSKLMTPYVKVALYDRYACCFYGSNRYDLFSDDASKLFYQFNISLRTAFRLPFNTHRIFMEGLSPSMHLKGQLCSRFVSFTKSLGSCHKLTIRFLFSLALADNRCVARRNLENIADECSLPIGELNCAAVKFLRKRVENVGQRL